MPKLIPALLVLALALLPTFLRPGEPANVAPFHWLVGKWKMQTKQGIIIESWKIVDDSSLAGSTVLVKSNRLDTVLLEKIQFVHRGNSYFYIPTVKRQNGEQPVSFEVTVFRENWFVAENLQHDFPKRIAYLRINGDSINARIDNGENDPDKKQVFYYSRFKN